MTRYRALREIGCDWVTAIFIDALNKIIGTPAGQIKFMHMTIEYDIEAAHGITGSKT